MATASTRTARSIPEEESLADRFRRLAKVWDEETAYLSSMTEASKHPAYQEIIRMGAEVVPLLLRDMQEHQTHWFIALREITGACPIPESASGNIPKMIQAWSDWASANGYRW